MDAQTFLVWQKRILASILQGANIHAALDALVRFIEEMNPGLICSIMLLRGGRLYFGAGPSLPEFYHKAVDGVEIGEGVGSCGTAAFRGQTVVVPDILAHPYWAAFTELMRPTGLAACWSEPIRATDGSVRGTFALYYRTIHTPSVQELEQIRVLADLAGTLVEYCTHIEARQIIEERLSTLAASIPGAVYELRVNPNGTMSFPFISAGIRALLGKPLGPVVPDARVMLDLIPATHRPTLLDSLQQSSITLEPWRHDFPVEVGDKLGWVRAHALPRRTPDGATVWSGLMVDVSGEKAVEAALAHAQGALARAARDVRTLSGAVASQLQDPVRVLAGVLALLHRRLEGAMGRDDLDLLDYAGTATTRLKEQLDAVQTLARVMSTTAPGEPVDLGRALAEATEAWASEMNRLGAEVVVAAGLPTLNGVESALVEMFRSLIGLALDRVHPDRPLRLIVDTRETAGTWEISLVDNGTGLSPSRPDEVPLEADAPFAPAAWGGQYLGFALVERVACGHAGTLRVEHRPGEGTTVTLAFRRPS
ncbi:GAF domain-containing protein [Pararhodospirillum oryzae]|uniref:histidine kinase n=1 Tax=Pararhodospirillum oryzae TaxID=478448 RepID=A0A512H581_9PROT|nr:GAF domain-containing protein [Pararhodospirillum oryzae]GEO80632.1 hypothetical protein ROR02_07630 [Pararhodospirillum oryzae]